MPWKIRDLPVSTEDAKSYQNRVCRCCALLHNITKAYRTRGATQFSLENLEAFQEEHKKLHMRRRRTRVEKRLVLARFRITVRSWVLCTTQ